MTEEKLIRRWTKNCMHNLIKSCELTITTGSHNDLRYHCDKCGEDYNQVNPVKKEDLAIKILYKLPIDIALHTSEFIWKAECECGSKSFSYRKDEGQVLVLDRWENDNFWSNFTLSEEKRNGYANMIGYDNITIPRPLFSTKSKQK